jgi:hypothetical protein
MGIVWYVHEFLLFLTCWLNLRNILNHHSG